ELERDLGTHAIEVFYGTATPLTATVALREGAHEVVTLVVPTVQAEGANPSPIPPNTPSPPSPATASGHPMRTAGFISLGAGGLFGAATIVAIVVRGAALSSIEKACPNYAKGQVCPANLRGDRSTGQTTSALANVFGGLALAGVG